MDPNHTFINQGCKQNMKTKVQTIKNKSNMYMKVNLIKFPNVQKYISLGKKRNKQSNTYRYQEDHESQCQFET